MFDEKTIQNLGFYVYILFDPSNNKPFYIGKGIRNRVFDHVNCALSEVEITNAKYEKIREIQSSGNHVGHIIVRHGLSEKESFEVESALIDSFVRFNLLLTNSVSGHNSIDKGIMTVDEIKRKYNSEPLYHIASNCILININRKYERGKGYEAIYEATKETWTINKKKLKDIKYVLSEYRGLIVEVFEVIRWYEKERGFLSSSKRYGQSKIGFGFEGKIAPDMIRKDYINRSIAHIKKKGAASAIRYNL